MNKKILSLLSIALFSLGLSQAQSFTPEQLKMLKEQQSSINDAKKGTTYQTETIETSFQRDSTLLTNKDFSTQREPKVRNSEKVFGREIFSQASLTFAPSMNMPTPKNYILAGGDQLNINVWGTSEQEFKVTISPDGYANLQGIGLIQLQGLSVASAENRIKGRLLERAEGIEDGSVFVNVSLGNIRSIKVNIAGEAKTPGTYTIPSLATLFNALYVAGGVSDIGSVRDIKLYRGDKLISTLDVYDYLLKGKTNVDMRLEDNDLIIVEPYHNLVTASGEVKRNMIYEMKANETLENLIHFAGGFTGYSYSDNINVSRSATGREKQLFTVNREGFKYFPMMDKDSVNVGKILDTYANRISISGPVWRAGNYELTEKTNSIKKLIEAAHGTREEAFLGRAQLLRLKDDRTHEMISVNLADILSGQAPDISLIKNDSLAVTAYDSLFQKRTISVMGEVNCDSTLVMEFFEGITLMDAVMQAKGFKESASFARIEVARRISSPEATAPSPNIAEIFSFKITGDLTLTPQSQNFKLMPFDIVTVRKSPGYNEQKLVTLHGEVVFDGQYVLTENNISMSDIIEKAGGFTAEANVRGAYLRRQKTQYDAERDHSIGKMMNAYTKDTLTVEKVSIGQYYTIAVDLQKAVDNPKSMEDVILQEGDVLVVPVFVNTVKISGSVYYPNTVTFAENNKLKDYIGMAGGFTQRARRKPFVIYQNGMIATSTKAKIEPGCEIVVPQKPEKRQMGAGEWMSLGTSAISMMAMISSLLK